MIETMLVLLDFYRAKFQASNAMLEILSSIFQALIFLQIIKYKQYKYMLE